MAHHRMLQKMRGSKTRLKVALASMVALGWVMVLSTTVWADAAPPAQPPGSNVDPGSGTMVQMVAENVLLWVYSLGNDVSVTADFAMRNQSTETEVLGVRFPMENPNGSGDGWGNHDWQVRDFSVRVDGVQLPYKIVQESYTEQSIPIPWATFEVEFPPNEDVIISVSYFTGLYGRDLASIQYVLGTGGGWYGPIGSAVITLRLPYAASPTNVEFVGVRSYDLQTIFVGNEVRWQVQNYEPGLYETFEASILWPSAWKEILDLEARIGENPVDLEAVIALAEAYRYEGVPPPELFALSNYTILQALALDPSNPALNAELAFNRWWGFPRDIKNALNVRPSDRFDFKDVDLNHAVVQNVLRPLMIALKEEPDSQKALKLLDEMRSMLGDFELPDEIPAFDLPVYTPTPQPTKWTFPTSTPGNEDTKEQPPSASTPHATATKIASTSTLSPQPTLQAELSPQSPESSNWIGFIAVGIASLGAGASIGYFMARRSM